MALIRWEPFREMDQLRRQMDRLFDELAQTNQGSLETSQDTQVAWVPAVELKDTGSEFLLRVELPGIEAENLDVHVTRDAISIAGEHRYEKQANDKGHFRSEFRYGRFQRVVPLPAQVQNDQAKADLKHGILTLNIPKVEAEQRRVFKVNLTGDQPAVTMADTTPDQTKSEGQTSVTQ